jgi:hypothetical protein
VRFSVEPPRQFAAALTNLVDLGQLHIYMGLADDWAWEPLLLTNQRLNIYRLYPRSRDPEQLTLERMREVLSNASETLAPALHNEIKLAFQQITREKEVAVEIIAEDFLEREDANPHFN